jgi:hypothetical protein
VAFLSFIVDALMGVKKKVAMIAVRCRITYSGCVSKTIMRICLMLQQRYGFAHTMHLDSHWSVQKKSTRLRTQNIGQDPKTGSRKSDDPKFGL